MIRKLWIALFGGCDHSWANWSVDRSFSSERSASVMIIQSRRCERCGKTQLNKEYA